MCHKTLCSYYQLEINKVFFKYEFTLSSTLSWIFKPPGAIGGNIDQGTKGLQIYFHVNISAPSPHYYEEIVNTLKNRSTLLNMSSTQNVRLWLGKVTLGIALNNILIVSRYSNRIHQLVIRTCSYIHIHIYYIYNGKH